MDERKFWVYIAVFLVIIGFFVGMYLNATPEKLAPVIQKQQAAKGQKKTIKDEPADTAGGVRQKIEGNELQKSGKIIEPVDISEELKAEKAIETDA